MVIKGSDRSNDIKTRELKPMEIRTAPRAAAQKAMRDKLEKQARDKLIANNYVNQNLEYSDQPAPENYGTEWVEQTAQRSETLLHTTLHNQTHTKAASPKREAAYRFMKREQTKKAAEQVQQRTAVVRQKTKELTVRVGKAVGEAVVKSFQSMSWMIAIPVVAGVLFLGAVWLSHRHCHRRRGRRHPHHYGSNPAAGQRTIRPPLLYPVHFRALE